MSSKDVSCNWCGKVSSKPIGEINRALKLGRMLFCGRSCSAHWGNRNKRSKEIVVVCPCGKHTKTSTRRRSAKHCSRSCAARFSSNITEDQKESSRLSGLANKGNLITVAELLKLREAWKYELLKDSLKGRNYEFEFPLDDYVFDLALLDEKILVEFDGPEHTADKTTVEEDRIKDDTAEKEGFVVIRRSVIPKTVIDPKTIEGL